MSDQDNRYRVKTVPGMSAAQKRLGGYLVDAGLLTPAQIEVALNDQRMTGMLFGEILATRGWVKQQTIDYLMKKVVEPERNAAKQDRSRPSTPPQTQSADKTANGDGRSGWAQASQAGLTEAQKTANRRDIPISKPLPSVPSADEDVSWVG